MTKQEKQKVREFFAVVSFRINRAKQAIRENNYGIALAVLEEAFPKLDLVEDEEG